MSFCTDNAAMIAGLGFRLQSQGVTSPLRVGVLATV